MLKKFLFEKINEYRKTRFLVPGKIFLLNEKEW
jgi:hypothetical protein